SIADLPVPTLILVAIVVLYLLNSIKILREYERGVIFRLGRALGTPKGPGIILVFRPIDQMVRISLRQEVLEVPRQDVITRDNVTIKVNAVVTLYVVNPNDAAIKVVNYVYQTSQFAQTTLRTVLGEVEREKRSKIIHAEGEFSAAQRLVDAAALLATEPMTIQLRHLQTLTEIGVEKNTTIVFPLPIEMMQMLNKMGASAKAAADKP